MVTGKIHSIQSLGTVDGQGVRFVVFTQGCNLRCGCCHNPDTWRLNVGKEYSANELVAKALRFKEYFGKDGGVTLSGGEPLLQTEFATEFFRLCRENGVNTCLDTSGSVLDDGVKDLLQFTDRVLLDIKYPTDEQYRTYVGCSIELPLAFLEYLNQKGIKTTLRQVIIPTLNNNEQSIDFINDLVKKYKVIDKVELLPFKKICKVKYDDMGMRFNFDKYPTPTADQMKKLNQRLIING